MQNNIKYSIILALTFKQSPQFILAFILLFFSSSHTFTFWGRIEHMVSSTKKLRINRSKYWDPIKRWTFLNTCSWSHAQGTKLFANHVTLPGFIHFYLLHTPTLIHTHLRLLIPKSPHIQKHRTQTPKQGLKMTTWYASRGLKKKKKKKKKKKHPPPPPPQQHTKNPPPPPPQQKKKKKKKTKKQTTTPTTQKKTKKTHPPPPNPAKKTTQITIK